VGHGLGQKVKDLLVRYFLHAGLDCPVVTRHTSDYRNARCQKRFNLALTDSLNLLLEMIIVENASLQQLLIVSIGIISVLRQQIHGTAMKCPTIQNSFCSVQDGTQTLLAVGCSRFVESNVCNVIVTEFCGALGKFQECRCLAMSLEQVQRN
jgi:hypothetical protein